MTRLRVAERRTLVRLAIASLIVVGAGVALGWRAGQTDDPPAAPAAKVKWSLEALKNEDPTKDLGILASLRPWSREAQQAKPEARAQAQAPQWRLAGIVQRGEEQYALIMTGFGPTAKFVYRRVGESFPDDSILVQMTSDSAMTQARSAPNSPPSSRPSLPV